MAGLSATANDPAQVSDEAYAAYVRDGYHIARGLFARAEIEVMREHFMALHARGPIIEVYTPEPTSSDPLKRHPRMMQPHRWDAQARRWLLDPRSLAVLRSLMRDEPVAAQSMFYFKPPGSEGQGFHQDNFYLMAHPGTCYAAWLAVDDADSGNGGLFVQPGSHRLPCYSHTDGRAKPWGELVPQPTTDQLTEVTLRAGDCLFFHGSLIHGSLANESSTRWRRSYICHFIGKRTSRGAAAYYFPLLNADGSIANDAEAVLDGWPGPAGNRVVEP
jgi:hypothetical protein